MAGANLTVALPAELLAQNAEYQMAQRFLLDHAALTSVVERSKTMGFLPKLQWMP